MLYVNGFDVFDRNVRCGWVVGEIFFDVFVIVYLVVIVFVVLGGCKMGNCYGFKKDVLFYFE